MSKRKKAKPDPARRDPAGSPRATVHDPLDVIHPFDGRDRADWTRLGLVVGVALVLRVAYFFLNKALNPTFYFPVMDSLYHHEWALDIVAGGTPGTDAFFRGPLYPYFLAVLYKLSGSSIAFAVFVNHVIGALTAGPFQRFGQQGVARREVRIEAAVGQAGFLHDVGHADAMEAGAADGAGGGLHDAVVAQLLAAGAGFHGRTLLGI